MHKILFNIHTFLKNHKILGLSLLIIYLLACLFFASKLQLEEDITRLIPSGERQDQLKKVLRETDLSDKLIISISARNDETSPDTLVSFAQKLTGSIESDLNEYVQAVQGKIPENDLRQVYTFVYENLPIFLDENDYDLVEKRLREASVRARLRSGYRQLMSPTGFVTKNYFLNDPLSITGLGLQKLRELQVGDNFGIYRNYLTTKDRKHIVLFIDSAYPSSETAKNEEFISKLDQLVNRLNSQYRQVEATYFGGVLYSLANANRIKKDIRLTLGIAGAILLIILILFYRKIYVPLLIFLPSIFGGLTAIALLSVFQGGVSAISLGIGAILLGITLDYALHILTHFRNKQDVRQLYRDISKPILMSSLTTAVAFLCLVFLNSEALIDLGIFASISVFMSSIFALILIPLFYSPSEADAKKVTFLDRIAGIDYSRKRPFLIALILIFAVSLFFFNKVHFNEDLSRINYEPQELKELQDRLEGLAGREGKSIYMVSYGNDLDEALQENNALYMRLKQLQTEGEINNFSSIGGVVLSTKTQNDRIENWSSFWTPAKIDFTRSKLVNLSSDLGFKETSFNGFYELLQKDFRNIDLADYKDAGSLYLNDFISEGKDFATVTSTVNLEPGKVDDFRKRFKNEPGIFALDRKALHQNFLGNLKDEFNKLIMISIIAVLFILILFYGNLELSLITLLPIGITWICALGIMAIFGFEFNILNIIISTFIFGLGLDYSIFITNASLKEYQTGSSDLRTYQSSILISVITTILGMGALIFAVHPALRSISIVSIIGVLTAVCVSFVLQRLLFRKLIFDRLRNGKKPFSIPAFFRSLRKEKSQTEKLYHKQAILDNYRYKSIYGKIKKEERISREKNFRLSQFIDKQEPVAIFNIGYGILPFFLASKFKGVEIFAQERDKEKLDLARNTPIAYASNIKFFNDLDEMPPAKHYILTNDFEDVEIVKKIIKANAEKLILIDTNFPYRWLLDMNFEIAYRQNNMLVLQKLT